MDYRIAEIIKTLRLFQNKLKTMPMANYDQHSSEVKEGLSLSWRVCEQPEEVVSTPIMKDLMTSLGDIKLVEGPNGEVHHTKVKTGQNTRAVAWLNKVVRAALLKYNGPEQHDYPEDIPVSSRRLYDIDCWNGWKEKVWDIQPGQEEQILEGSKIYMDPKTNMSIPEVIWKLQREPALQQSVLALLDELPQTTASREVTKINDPFMSKGSGVSYPDYRNDRSYKDPDAELTYAKYEIQLAQAAYNKGISSFKKFAFDNNVYTLYARFQRGAGRPLIAQSRRTNLVINTVNGPEMESWKASEALRAAFVDEEQLLLHLSQLGDWVLAHPGSDAANLDYSKWDRNLGQGWIALQDAVRYLKATDDMTRQIILVRFLCNAKGYLVNGLLGRVTPIFGRMTSGYLDTTLGNSAANRAISRATICMLDRNHIRDYTKPLNGKDLTVVGDDLLVIGKKGFIKVFAPLSNRETNTVMHEDEKHARGIMFIQYRAWINEQSRWVMAYNWPRVLRSMCSKENTKQLGRAGWTFSFYQQLGKLLMSPRDLAIPTNITAAMDRYHLSLDVPVAKLIEMVQEEDAKRVKKDDPRYKEKASKKNTTAEQLYNSNPNIPGVILRDNGRLELDAGYFEKVQAKLKAVYDPEWLPTNLGIPNPDLRKVSPAS